MQNKVQLYNDTNNITSCIQWAARLPQYLCSTVDQMYAVEKNKQWHSPVDTLPPQHRPPQWPHHIASQLWTLQRRSPHDRGSRWGSAGTPHLLYTANKHDKKSDWTERYEAWKQCTFALSVKLKILRLTKNRKKNEDTERIIYGTKRHLEVCERGHMVVSF